AHAEVGRADGARVSRRPRADHDQVEALVHQTSSRSRAGSSRRSFTRTRKVTACSPSTRRWSYERARYIIGRTTISSFTTTGRFSILCMPRIPLWGGVKVGVGRSGAVTPPLWVGDSAPPGAPPPR